MVHALWRVNRGKEHSGTGVQVRGGMRARSLPSWAGAWPTACPWPPRAPPTPPPWAVSRHKGSRGHDIRSSHTAQLGQGDDPSDHTSLADLTTPFPHRPTSVPPHSTPLPSSPTWPG